MKSFEIHVAGGVYRERCRWPYDSDQVLGSAGRAAQVLSNSAKVTLHTCLGPDLVNSASLFFEPYDISLMHQSRPQDILFDYVHSLAEPRIVPNLVALQQVSALSVCEENVIRFGMLECDVVVEAAACVFDPQSAYNPVGFGTNGSKADRLVVVANRFEAFALTGESDVERAAVVLRDREHAEAVVVKSGLDGAWIASDRGINRVPAYKVSRANTIGSGDVFVAAFARFWLQENLHPVEAARLASLTTAEYIELGLLPPTIPPLERPETRLDKQKVYLAGPFFSISQRWLVDEVRRCCFEVGLDVFSPVHNVGRGPANVVAAKDLDGIRSSDCVLAIVDGLDSGTIFEIGYAKALGKQVYCLVQSTPEEDLKMIDGSGCIVSDDLVSLVFQIAQA